MIAEVINHNVEHVPSVLEQEVTLVSMPLLSKVSPPRLPASRVINKHPLSKVIVGKCCCREQGKCNHPSRLTKGPLHRCPMVIKVVVVPNNAVTQTS